MDKLSANSAMCILMFLDWKSIYAFLKTHKRLFGYWNEDSLWATLIHRETPPCLTLNYDLSFGVSSCSHFKPYLCGEISTVTPKSFLRSVASYFHCASQLPLNPVAQSSNDYDQEISWTTSNNTYKFWSSIGSTSPDGEEFLRYSLPYPSLIFWVQVQLSYEVFGDRNFVYSPAQFRIKVGMADDHWDYVSDPISAEATFLPQNLVVLPRLVVGKLIQIDLIGKTIPQYMRDMYYITVAKFKSFGLPLDPSGLNLDPSSFPPAVTLATFDHWSHLLSHSSYHVHRDILTAFRDIGKLKDYFAAAAGVRDVALTFEEVAYMVENYEGLGNNIVMRSTNVGVVKMMGHALKTRGRIREAINYFLTTIATRDMIECYLELKQYNECVELIGTCPNVTVADVQEVAKKMGKEVASKVAKALGHKRR